MGAMCGTGISWTYFDVPREPIDVEYEDVSVPRIESSTEIEEVEVEEVN